MFEIYCVERFDVISTMSQLIQYINKINRKCSADDAAEPNIRRVVSVYKRHSKRKGKNCSSIIWLNYRILYKIVLMLINGASYIAVYPILKDTCKKRWI